MTLSTSINNSPAGYRSLKISDLCRILNTTEADIWKDVRSGWLPKPIKTQKGNRWVRDDLRGADYFQVTSLSEMDGFIDLPDMPTTCQNMTGFFCKGERHLLTTEHHEPLPGGHSMPAV